MTLSELFDKADEMVAKRYPDCNASIKEMNSYRDGYIHGMTEKLEGMVPVEKVKKWLNAEFYVKNIRRENSFGEVIYYDEVASEFETMEEVFECFLEAMEE